MYLGTIFLNKKMAQEANKILTAAMREVLQIMLHKALKIKESRSIRRQPTI